MSNVMIDSSYMTGIANAIRTKSGTQDTYLPSEMPSAITNIPTGNIVPNYPLNNGKNNIWVLINKTPTTITATLKTSGDTVNWGDGTINTNTTHTYSTVGIYCIQADSLYTVDENIINAEFNHTTTDINSLSFTNSVTLTNLKVSTTDYTTIARNAFRNCISLTTVNFPNTLTTINSGAFNNCTSLNNIDLSNITLYGGGNSGNGAFQNCTSLTSVTIGAFGSDDTVQGDFFNGCTALTTVTINGGLYTGRGAFNGCTALTSVNLPNTITTINRYCFTTCIALTEITIPASVTDIGQYAFYGKSGRIFHFLGTTPPTLANASNSIGSNPVIYVPASAVTDYQTAWSQYASYIQAEPSN